MKGNWPPERARNIARLAFRRVQELTRREAPGRSRTIDRLATEPVRVARGASDEQIAQAVAAEVCRSLREG